MGHGLFVRLPSFPKGAGGGGGGGGSLGGAVLVSGIGILQSKAVRDKHAGIYEHRNGR
jgi:hypothetical protein